MTGLGASRRPRARGWVCAARSACEGPRRRVGEREGGGEGQTPRVSLARASTRAVHRVGRFPNAGVCGKGCEGFDTARETLLRDLRFIARGVRARKGARGGPRDRARARETPATRSGHYPGALARTSTVERTNATAARSDDGASESRFFFATCCVARKREGTHTAKTGAAGSSGSDSAGV